MKMLHLPVKAKWYEMEVSGIKKEEYREITDYWCKRLLVDIRQPLYFFDESVRSVPNICFKRFEFVRMRRGYTKTFTDFERPTIRIGRGNPDWGAPLDRDVFIISLNENMGNKMIDSLEVGR